MSTMILACSSLQDYINAAQEKLGTDYRVVYMDKKYHFPYQHYKYST